MVVLQQVDNSLGGETAPALIPAGINNSYIDDILSVAFVLISLNR